MFRRASPSKKRKIVVVFPSAASFGILSECHTAVDLEQTAGRNHIVNDAGCQQNGFPERSETDRPRAFDCFRSLGIEHSPVLFPTSFDVGSRSIPTRWNSFAVARSRNRADASISTPIPGNDMENVPYGLSATVTSVCRTCRPIVG